MHIDFGFILEISPGGNMRFESAAFKLSHEMTLIVDPGGRRQSKHFKTFEDLVVRGFLAVSSPAVLLFRLSSGSVFVWYCGVCLKAIARDGTPHGTWWPRRSKDSQPSETLVVCGFLAESLSLVSMIPVLRSQTPHGMDEEWITRQE